jgi:hypothetical protein
MGLNRKENYRFATNGRICIYSADGAMDPPADEVLQWPAKSRRIRLIRGGKDPIKGQNSQQPGTRYFTLPATSRIFAGDFHFTEDLHGLVLRERGLRALPLQIDVVPILRARKHNSVGVTHNLMIARLCAPDQR